MDRYKIDSHKLMYHPGRIGDWLAGKTVYPVYMEVSPAGSCNHRCVYCALDFMKYQSRFIDAEILKDRLEEMGRIGVKSIMYAGEGEPFLHKDIGSIISATRASGIDVAVTSNGVLFNEKVSGSTLPYLTWIKISINAARPETYAKIHRTRPDDFKKVVDNMACAAKLRRKNEYACTLGMQIVLLPDNYDEVVLLARKAEEIGMDYLVVKPYSQHPSSITDKYKNIKYGKYTDLAEKLKKLNSARFNVIFRINTMKKWDNARHDYKHCLAMPFWAYIDAGGDVWACSIYLTKKKFCLGNIYKNSFKEIWKSKKRTDLVKWAAGKLDTGKCRINCRMDEANRYLWDLSNAPEHVNFI